MAKKRFTFTIILSCTLTLTAGSAFSGTNDDTLSTSELKSLSIEELLNIEVTSVSKRAEKLSETPSAIQVITGEEIRRSGATTIPEALRLANNLQVAQRNSESWGISARGFNTDLANKLLVLIDGRTVYTPLYSGVFWSRQDYLLEDIDRIEVISGPGGTLWGANAVNGVINIITKSAENTQDIYVEQMAGNELRGGMGGRYGGEISSNAHYRVYGKYFDRDNAKYEDGREAADSWRKSQLGFRLDAAHSINSGFTFQGDYYYIDLKTPYGGNAETWGGNILGRWTKTLSETSDLSLQLYFDQTHFKTAQPAVVINSILLAPAGTFEDELDTYDFEFHHRFNPSGRLKLIWGLGFRFTHDVNTNAPPIGFLPDKLDQDLFSAFVQDEIAVRENVTLTIGSKIENNDYTGWELEPNARLSWRVNERNMLWAAVSRAVRAPSRIDRDLIQPTPPYFVILVGNPDFVSETVIANEFGFRFHRGTRFTGSASIFYNIYDNIRSLSFTPTVLFPLFFENNVEGESYGLELNGNYQLRDWWQVNFGYTYLETELEVKPGEFDYNETLNETSDPEQQFSLRSAMDLPKNFELDSKLRWVDFLKTHEGPTPGVVPSYFELDVRIAYQLFDELEFSMVGQNLLHDRHPEYGYPNSSRVEIERNIYGKATWRF